MTMTGEVHAFLAKRTIPIHLVIFDCDGVLIDSEALCDRVVAASITELGWTITPEECHHRFLGLSFYDMVPTIEDHIGQSVGTGWVDDVVRRLTAVFATEVEPIQGAHAALMGITLPWRVASNSSFTEMDAKFARVGWTDLMGGRLHSGADIVLRGGRGKPAPDVFLEAAAAQAIDPRHCLVVEDSLIGAQAARAAGMACLGYCPDHDGTALRTVGAIPFRSMWDLPELLAPMSRC